jgi:hypothetical protein
MFPSGKIGAAFAGVFLIGALSGGLITWGFTDRKLATFMNNINDPDAVIVERINKKYVHDYQLTPDELARIQPLVQAMAHHSNQTRHQFALAYIKGFESIRAQIAAQLDPAHRKAYEAATVKRDQELREMLLIDSAAPDQGQK